MTSAKSMLTGLDKRAWIWVIAPLTICLSFILSVGPTVQTSLVGLLSSDAPTIYGTAYNDTLIRFLTLGEWLLTGVHWLYLLMAGLIVLISIRAQTFSSLLGWLGASSFVVLCIFDTFFGLIDGTVTIAATAVNVGSNLVGSVLIALVLAAILWIYETVCELAPAPAGKFAGFGVLVGLGIVISSTCYFVLAYFYKPLTVDFTMVAKAPSQGAYVASKSNKPKSRKNEGDPRFSLLPVMVRGGSGEVIAPGGATIVEWHSNQSKTTFNVVIDFFSDCMQPTDLRRMPIGLPSIKREDVKSLVLSSDQGLDGLFIAADPMNSFSYSAHLPILFWLKKKKSSMEIQFFGGQNSELENSGSDGQLFYVRTFLMKTDRSTKVARIVPRNLKFVIDGETISLDLKRPGLLNPKGKLDCRAFNVIVPDNSRIQKDISPPVPDNSMAVGARIQIAPNLDDTVEEYGPNVNVLRIAKANGWSKISEIKDSELAGKFLGTAEYLIVEDGLTELKIDGKTVAVKRADQFAAVGELSGGYQDDVSIRVEGRARAIWLDGKRRNPTKWERLPLEVQLFVLGGLIAALGALVKIWRPIIRRIHDNKPLHGLP